MTDQLTARRRYLAEVRKLIQAAKLRNAGAKQTIATSRAMVARVQALRKSLPNK